MNRASFRTIRVFWLLTTACLMAAGAAFADVTTFNNEAEFARKAKASGPFHAPGVLAGKSINVDSGRIVIKPGTGVIAVSAQKPADRQFTMVYVGNEAELSNLDISLGGPATAFGFLLHNETDGGIAGDSEFKITLFNGGKQVGETQVSAPAAGEIFVGLQSTEPFDMLTIREAKGGPQHGAKGDSDREFFGKFYTDAKAGKKGGGGAGGLVPPPMPPPPPLGQGGVAEKAAPKPGAAASFVDGLDSMQWTLIAVAGGAVVIAGGVTMLALLYLLFRGRPKKDA